MRGAFSLLRRLRSLPHPKRRRAPANRREGIWNLRSYETAPGEGGYDFWEMPRSSSQLVLCLKSSIAVNLPLRHQLLHSVSRTIFVRPMSFVFPKAKTQYIRYCLNRLLIMFSDIMILLCFVASMIELFMIYLF